MKNYIALLLLSAFTSAATPTNAPNASAVALMLNPTNRVPLNSVQNLTNTGSFWCDGTTNTGRPAIVLPMDGSYSNLVERHTEDGDQFFPVLDRAGNLYAPNLQFHDNCLHVIAGGSGNSGGGWVSGSLANPFSDIESALGYATNSGVEQMILVHKGNYNVTGDIWRPGVNYYFESGAKVSTEGDFLFSDRYGPVTNKVHGYGEFYQTVAGSVTQYENQVSDGHGLGDPSFALIPSVLCITNRFSDFYFEAQSCTSSNTTGDASVVNQVLLCKNGTIVIREQANNLSQVSDVTLPSVFYWGLGNVDYTCPRNIMTNSSGPGYVIWGQAMFSQKFASGMEYLNDTDLYLHNITTEGPNIALGMDAFGLPEYKVWALHSTLYQSGSASGFYAPVFQAYDGGKYYLIDSKIKCDDVGSDAIWLSNSGNPTNTTFPKLWIKSEKLTYGGTNAFVRTTAGTNLSPYLNLEIQQYEDLNGTASGFNLAGAKGVINGGTMSLSKSNALAIHYTQTKAGDAVEFRDFACDGTTAKSIFLDGTSGTGPGTNISLTLSNCRLLQTNSVITNNIAGWKVTLQGINKFSVAPIATNITGGGFEAAGLFGFNGWLAPTNLTASRMLVSGTDGSVTNAAGLLTFSSASPPLDTNSTAMWLAVTIAGDTNLYRLQLKK